MSNKMLKRVFTGQIKSIDEKENTLTAYVSTGAVDRMNEVLDPQGIDLRNYKKNPVVLWAHDYSAPPIGKALWVKKDGNGIVSKVKFATTEFAKEIFELYKGGFLNAFSVGFIPKEHQDGDGKKDPRRTYTKWEMLEYSAVPVPANPEALALAMQKGLVIPEVVSKAIEQQENSEEEVVTEFDNTKEDQPLEYTAQQLITKEKEEIENGLDELLAENAQLKEQIQDLNEEITDLKFQQYKILEALQKERSEIAVNDFAAKFVEIVNGAIRKAQGKVD